MKKYLAVMATTAAMLACVNAPYVAYAAEPDAAASEPVVDEGVIQPGPPDEAEEALVPAPESDAPLPLPDKSSDEPNAEYCQPRNVYVPTANKGKVHKPIGAQQANYNGTSRTARSWFKSEASGEVGVEISGELKVGVSPMIASIEGKYGVNLSAKLSVKVGNEIQVDTPPRKTTYAKYGVWRMKNTGTSYVIYSNCRTSAKSTVTSHTPWHVGWYLWER
ncbi:hypothetical protein [Streptomyces solincola]|nr:hypothetical protein [Streptomyces solincola]